MVYMVGEMALEGEKEKEINEVKTKETYGWWQE